MSKFHPRRNALVAVAVIAITGSMTACSSGSSGSASGTYNIGINAELTGPVAFYGVTIRDGVQAWAQKVNASGGINGHKVKLSILDNAGVSSRAATNMTQLATEDNVSGVLGNTLSSNCTASTPNAVRYKVPLACLSVAAPSPWVFSLGADNTTVADATLSAAKQLTGLSNPKLAFAYPNAPTNEILAAAIAKKAPAAGVDVVSSQEFSLTTSDFSSTYAKIIAAKPDIVVTTGGASSFTSILAGLRAGSDTVPAVYIDGTSNLSSLTNVTDSNIYGFSTYQLAGASSATGAAKTFVDAITPVIGKSKVTDATIASGGTAYAYLTATAWGQALQKCGYPCSGAQLQPILSKLTAKLSPMVSGFSYNNSIHYPYPQWYLYKISQGVATTKVGTFSADVK